MLPSFSPFNVHLIAGLIDKEAPTKVFDKYVNFAFSPNLVSKLSKRIGINNHAIELVNSQQPP